ncbi:nuclear transport factor 2 family protein [Aquimarina sp. U1-2]|uniref:nuclear transport factor 2 family protein n=1 Tax=Aquimarina sp. U1-2 TaxID=2823141 RepID=UPI001AEC741C|nr:nuclear transport factor 2 family protein [Aquimarina sp. U1-2]MBP2833782.1 nuclear transport factor 2 family protein [Aquimarina sp. U1-2]
MKNLEKEANRFLDILVAGDIDGVRDIWHKDGTLEFPFSPKGAWTVEGRDKIVDYFKDAFKRKRPEKFVSQPALLMADGEHLFMEFKGYLKNSKNEKYTNDYCVLFQFKDDKLFKFREFYNTLIREKYEGQ